MSVQLIDKQDLYETLKLSSCAISPLDTIRDFPVSSYAQLLTHFKQYVFEECYMNAEKFQSSLDFNLSNDSIFYFGISFSILFDIIYACGFLDSFLEFCDYPNKSRVSFVLSVVLDFMQSIDGDSPSVKRNVE